MMIKRLALAGLFASGSLFAATTAYASSVSVTYTTLTSFNPDVQLGVTGTDTGLVQSTLGPDGLPVSTGKIAFQDVNSSGELLWWTPNTFGGNPAVIPGTTFPYPSPVTLPFNITGGFFPNGPGGSNGGDVGYTSAILKGTSIRPPAAA